MGVVKTKQRYDATVSIFGDHMDKRDALKRDELIKRSMKSNKSYDDILRLLKDNECQDEQ